MSVTNIAKNTPKELRTLELKVERCLDPRFGEALRKLTSLPMQPKAAMRLKKANKLIYEMMKEYIAKRDEVFKNYCDRDEKNEIVYEDAEKTRYKVKEENIEPCDKELTVIAAKFIQVPTIHVNEFPNGLELTADFVAILDGLITDY